MDHPLRKDPFASQQYPSDPSVPTRKPNLPKSQDVGMVVVIVPFIQGGCEKGYLCLYTASGRGTELSRRRVHFRRVVALLVEVDGGAEGLTVWEGSESVGLGWVGLR